MLPSSSIQPPIGTSQIVTKPGLAVVVDRATDMRQKPLHGKFWPVLALSLLSVAFSTNGGLGEGTKLFIEAVSNFLALEAYSMGDFDDESAFVRLKAHYRSTRIRSGNDLRPSSLGSSCRCGPAMFSKKHHQSMPIDSDSDFPVEGWRRKQDFRSRRPLPTKNAGRNKLNGFPNNHSWIRVGSSNARKGRKKEK